MGQTIGNIQLDLGINSSGFKRQLNSISKTAKTQTSAMSGMFSKLGRVVAGAFAVKKIVEFSKACLDLGSDLAEVQNVVDVTFGSMSNQVNDFAKNAMESYGLSEKVAKQYMGTFGAMSKSFGYTTDEAYEQAAALTGLAGDVASFYNLTTDEAYTKLKSVFTGETESLKDLGVVMTQTALDEYALQQGMGKTTSQMSEQEKVALRLAFVQDRLATASGDFARTSDGWANQTRVLALRFDALKASIGQGLIAALTPVVKLLNTLMVYLQAAADAFSNFMQAVFGKQQTAMAGAGAALTEGMGVASSASDNIASNSADAAKSAKAIKKSLAGFDQLNILSSSSDTGGGAVGAGSSGAGAGMVGTDVAAGNSAIDAMKAKLDGLKTKLQEFANITGLSTLWDKFLIGVNNGKTGVINLFDRLKAAVVENAPRFDTLKETWTNTFTTTAQTITTIWGDMWMITGTKFKEFTENYGPQIQQFLSNLCIEFTNFGILAGTAIGDIASSLKGWWETDGSRIFGEIQKIIYSLGGSVLELWNEWVHPVIQHLQDAFATLWSNHLKPLWDEVLMVITSIWDAVMAIWNNVLKPVIDWLVNRFGPPIVNVCNTIINIFKTVFAAISDNVKSILKSLRGALDFITGVFTGDWKKAWNGIKTFFGGIWDGMVVAMKTPINLMIDLVEGMVNGVISGINGMIRALNGLSFDIPDWVPGLGGKKFGLNIREISTLNIPRLATGGYVEANSPQLAVIGDNKREGEIVAPESKIAEAVATGVAAAMRQFIGLMGNKTEQRTPLVIKIGEEDFWSGFIDYHNSVVKRTGDSPLLI